MRGTEQNAAPSEAGSGVEGASPPRAPHLLAAGMVIMVLVKVPKYMKTSIRLAPGPRQLPRPGATETAGSCPVPAAVEYS